jgi:hypothetical protein
MKMTLMMTVMGPQMRLTDGIPESIDTGDDNDGVSDAEKASSFDLDYDGTPDATDIDNDYDGIPDATDTHDDNDGSRMLKKTRDLVEASNSNFDKDGIREEDDKNDDGDGIADTIVTMVLKQELVLMRPRMMRRSRDESRLH